MGRDTSILFSKIPSRYNHRILGRWLLQMSPSNTVHKIWLLDLYIWQRRQNGCKFSSSIHVSLFNSFWKVFTFRCLTLFGAPPFLPNTLTLDHMNSAAVLAQELSRLLLFEQYLGLTRAPNDLLWPPKHCVYLSC